MTINEFLRESEMYEFSNEYFQLLKDVSEITLLERFIENQEFLLENPNLVSYMNESYFMEAKEPLQLAAGKEKVDEKKKNILKVMWGKVIKLWNAVLSFGRSMLKRLMADKKPIAKTLVAAPAEVIEEVQDKIEDIIVTAETASKMTVSTAQKKSFVNAVRSIPKRKTRSNPERNEKQKLPNIPFNHDAKNNQPVILLPAAAPKSVEAKMNILFMSDIEFVVTKDKYPMALSPSQIKELVKIYTSVITLEIVKYLPGGGDGKIKSAIQTIEKFHAENMRNGIMLARNEESLKSLIEDAERAREKVNNDTIKKLFADSEQNKHYSVHVVVDFINMIHTCIAQSIAMYGHVYTFHSTFVNAIGNIISKRTYKQVN